MPARVEGRVLMIGSVFSPDKSTTMAILTSRNIDYAGMVSHYASFRYNGYSGWRLADAHEVIYA